MKIFEPALSFSVMIWGHVICFHDYGSASPLGYIIPYYEEILPESVFIVDNSTLIPVPSLDLSGLALQNATTQFHTHLNLRFPGYINERHCLCQLAFHANFVAADDVHNAQVDVFELETPTNETHHPNISGYHGRWIAKELIPGTGVAYTEFGIQPFNCSSLKMGGLLVGYEVAPKWWDDTVHIDVHWSGESQNCFIILLIMCFILYTSSFLSLLRFFSWAARRYRPFNSAVGKRCGFDSQTSSC